MDYSRLRATAMRDGQDEEAVTVDTRALIDKVLARYSGEWTTLRELIQNAADAQANTVKVKWETMPSTSVALPSTTNSSELLKHAISNHTLRRLVVQNDGQPFTKTDWGRLKRIAEGNPDETKIGAFGVGFYSVFADCEEPFVSSGSEAMAFYWKGNALFTKKVVLPEEQSSKDTVFVLDYRNTTTPLPNLLSVSQFLATSLTFVALQHIEFWIDDWKILSLHKKQSPSVGVAIPRDLETRTRDGLMSVKSVDRTSSQIDASFMGVIGWKPQISSSAKQPDSYGIAAAVEAPSLRNFFSRLTSGASHAGLRGKAHKEEAAAQEAIAEDVTKLSTSSIFLRVSAATIHTRVTDSFAAELERATKKPPPKSTKISILTSSYDETQASENSNSGNASKVADVFASVLPSKKPGGRIFIGFPTTQTSGAGMHVSAPSLIPTVEREAIDLNARWVRNWNVEMLRAAGILTRLAYTNEMADLDAKLRRPSEKGSKSISDADVTKFMPEAMHILKSFTFRESTPSGQVGQIMEEAFWTSYKKPSVEIYSSRGVLQTSKVRIGSEELSKFVDGIPVIPKQLKDDLFVKKLNEFGLISPITVDDIAMELEAKTLTADQLINFIGWAGKKALIGELDPPSRSKLLQVAVATVSKDDSEQGGVIALGSVTNYIVASAIPPTVPVPPTTIPHAFTSTCSARELQALGWDPLEMVPWLKFVLVALPDRGGADTEQNMTKSPKFALQVLTVLSKAWDSMANDDKKSIINLLQSRTVMPTKLGMRKPTDSFYPSVKLFDDLPNIQNCQNLKDKFLAAIGVRKTVDLDTIFTRLLNPSKEDGGQRWSHMELIRYLASVKDDIPNSDMAKLKESRICPAEAGPKGLEPTKGTTELYKVSELFEPKDTLRALNFRILQWPGPPGSFRSSSPEGRFLAVLGLRSYPLVPELVDMMTSSNLELRTQAMTYFIANHHINGYAAFDLSSSPKTFLPLRGNEKKLVAPSACFSNEAASVLGFDILRPDLHVHASKFGVRRDPPVSECVARLLANPPRDHPTATKLFSYFALRLSDMGENSLSKLRGAAFVPVTRQASSGGKAGGGSSATTITHVAPQRCFLGTSTTYGDIFDFVDFGGDANTFLFRCGAKSEPTKAELAELACSEPARLLGTLQSPEKYMNLLKTLAESFSTLKRDKELLRRMKSAPFLLAYKEIPSTTKGKLVDLDEEDEEAPIKQYQLAPANQIVILDDIISHRLFKEHLIVAPEEEELETFYLLLGAQNLSSVVEEDPRTGPLVNKPDLVTSLRKHVVERTKIFLHEYAGYKRNLIKHDAKWLEKNLVIEVVRTLSLRRTLRGRHQYSHMEKRSAAVVHSHSRSVLYISDQVKPDMFQVGQAICQLLLTRANQQAYIFFEPFLTLDLLGLRARGYNVDRILRAKAAEARVAEEERRKALEAEQTRIREQEQRWNEESHVAEAARQQAAVKTPEVETPMPGSFGDDSPEDSHQQQASSGSRPHKKGRSLFANLTRRLGFDADDHADDQLRQLTDGSKADSPYTREGGEEQQHADGRPSSRGKQKRKEDGRVTSPATIEQNLLNAIHSTRAHDSNHLFAPPSMNEVKEQASYCDSTPAANIVFAAEASNGMKVFRSRDLTVEPGQFLTTHAKAINSFASLLVEVGGIYALSPKVIHVFYDEVGSTIAFNSQGSIFCNLRFFMQLHATKLEGTRKGEGRAEAGVWWWVVIAHELAHNLVQPHNSDHSYYTESFIQQYFPKMVLKTTQWVRQQQDEEAGSQSRSRPTSHSQSHSHSHSNSNSASASASASGRASLSFPQGAPPPYSESR